MAHKTDGNNTNSIFLHLVPNPKELPTRAFDIPKPARRDSYLLTYLLTHLLTYLLTIWSSLS